MNCQYCGAEILNHNSKFCPKCGKPTQQQSIVPKTPVPLTQQNAAIWPEWKMESKPIGKGSYGAVYKAERNNHNVQSFAAIKVISIPADSSEIDSFRAEGLNEDATKKLLHGIVDDFVSEIQLMESLKGMQNIVSVEDYEVVEKTGEIGWDIYIRMELLTPFNAYICNKTLSEEDVTKLGTDICTALEICEKRNIIHRDIKPENIFINDFGSFKLGDFGIARKLENVTGGLSQKGTYNYMAPEVANGTHYDARVDTYSLGVVLYRLLNGNRLPFLNNDQQVTNANERRLAVERRIQGEELPVPCNASPEMADVILRACAYDPEKRFASATEMKEALLAVKNGTYIIPVVTDMDKTTAVRKVQGDSDKTISVRKAPTADNEPHYQSVETFAAPKKGKKKIKAILIICAILAFLLTAGFFALRWYFSPEQKIKRALENDNIELALQIRDEDMAGEENEDLEKAVEDRIHNTWGKYERGEIDYIVVKEQLSDIKDMKIEAVSELLEETSQKVEELNDSRTAFNTAETMMQEESYIGAIEQYRLVIESDSNYQTAMERIATATDLYRSKVLSAAQALADGNDFVGAIDELKSGLEALPNDATLTQELRINEEALEKQLKETAAEDAREYADKGDYPAAIKLLDKAIKEYPNDSALKKDYDKYCDEYVAQVLDEVDGFLEENDYTGAISAIKAAQKTLPDNEELSDKLAAVEAAKPISLTSLTPINSKNWPEWNAGSPKDPFGNDYSTATNFCIFNQAKDWDTNSYYLEYRVYGKYQTFIGMLAPYTTIGENEAGFIQVYVDDELRYTSPNIGRKTDAFEFSVDISGGEYLKIVFIVVSQYENSREYTSAILSNFQLFPQ